MSDTSYGRGNHSRPMITNRSQRSHYDNMTGDSNASFHRSLNRSNFFDDVAAVRIRNSNRKRIEVLFSVSSVCCVVLFIIRYRRYYIVSDVSGHLIFAAFTLSLLMSVVWAMQLIRLYNFQPLVVSRQQKMAASIRDDEDGFVVRNSEKAASVTMQESDATRYSDILNFSKMLESSHSIHNDFQQQQQQQQQHSFQSERFRDECKDVMFIRNQSASGAFNRSFEDDLMPRSFARRSLNDKPKDQHRSSMDGRPTCHRLSGYLPAIPTPLSSKVSTTGRKHMKSIYDHLEIERYPLEMWRENLRKWFCDTLLKPLSEEIDRLNQCLRNTRLKIGIDSVEHLRSAVTSISSSLSSIDVEAMKQLLCYLEVSTNQEYLVRRIKDLSQMCMSHYRWNGVGATCHRQQQNREHDPAARSWAVSEGLPADVDLVFHIFCSFMNSIFTPSPMCTDGRVFFFHHTKGVVMDNKLSLKGDKPVLDQPVIWRYESAPSTFKLLYEQFEYVVDPGQYNLFDTIIGFLLIVKKYKNGRLGPVSLRSVGSDMMDIVR